MRRKHSVSLAMAAAAVLVCGTVGFAAKAKFNKVVEIGAKAPVWKGLVGVDDKKHSLEDYKDAHVLVTVFTCNHCPVAVDYQDRLIQFTKDYQEKGVQVVAINVNNIEPDKLDKMKERAAEKGFNFPYLYDPTQKVGHDYGATVTPHVFVLNKERAIAYMGAVDDNQNAEKVTKHYLRDAVNALLDGSRPAVAESQQFGCSIKYDN